MNRTRRLGWLFALAVILPGALLAGLAVRAIRREEAFIEKQLATGLSAEVLQLASAVGEELRRIEEELARGAPTGPAQARAFAAWKKGSPLVGVPFLLSPGYDLLWPRAPFGDAEREFLLLHGEFLANRQPVPVYTNIALAFRDEIVPSEPSLVADVRVRAERAEAEGGAEAVGAAGEAGSDAPEAAPPAAAPAESGPPAAITGEELELGAESIEDAVAAAEAPAGAAPIAGAARERQAESAQQAVSAFESDQEVRRKVYAQAESKGQPAAPRNVSPQIAQSGSAQEPKGSPGSPPPSVFVSEPRRFRQITSGDDSGLIPRLLEERLWLLFWKRIPDGRIVGCQLEDAEVRARFIVVLPPAATPERILTLLDERGGPIFAPAEPSPRDYRQPFVAREVSELLPRWEAAAYLTDPSLVSSRARLTGSILWALIALLVVAIAGGAALVLRALGQEVRLARQKSSFVANVSHELKTPLTSIRMYAEMLQEGRQRDPAKRRQYLGAIVEEAQRLTRLVNRVLDFSRLERGRRRYDKKELDLERLCRGVVEGERPRLEQAGFRVHFDAGGWREAPARRADRGSGGQAVPQGVIGDQEALTQVLLNLLSNAEKYSEEKKEVVVELTREAGKPRVRVLDRGRGVASQQARMLFREFYRADEKLTSRVQGTGLGLAIARRIVRDHGGELRYLPRPGGGSIFQIELP